MTPRYLRLDDGTIWPSVEQVREYEYLYLWGEPDDAGVANLAAGYIHLVCHPAGTEDAIRKLRAIRRAHRAAMAARRDAP
jgi:hypothetical protein